MIFLKTEDEIELLRQSNLLVGRTLAEVAKVVKPGVTTRELDKVAEEFILEIMGQFPLLKVSLIHMDLHFLVHYVLPLMNKLCMVFLMIFL